MQIKTTHSIHNDGALAMRALTKLLSSLASHHAPDALVAHIRRGLAADAAWLVIEEERKQHIESDGAIRFTLAQAQKLISHSRLRRRTCRWHTVAWPRECGLRFFTGSPPELALLQTGVICKFHADNYQTTGYLFVGFTHAFSSTVIIKRTLTIIAQKLGDYLTHLLARQNAVREMQHLVAQYKMIFENAPVLMNSFDVANRCILWNGECERLFGWDQEELNQHDDPLALFYPDPDVRQQWRESIKLTALTDMREWHPLRRDGVQLTTLWSSILLPDNTVLNIGLDITARKKAERLLARKATIDDLTQCYNRAEIMRQLAQTMACPERAQAAIIMMDIDHFKTINDTFGHQGGDAALSHFCELIRACPHPAMSAGRLGGEEFLLILQRTTSHEAYLFTEALRERLAHIPLLFNREPVRLSFSAGIVGLNGWEGEPADALRAADDALYEAKRAGRGRSIIASGAGSTFKAITKAWFSSK